MSDRLTDEQRALGDVLDQVAVWLKRSRSAGVSATTLSVLNRLTDAGPLRITELASREGVSQPAMTTVVDRLQDRRWATRAVDPTDRRATLVTVTPAGRAHIVEHRRARAQVVADRMAALPDADQRALVAALPALRRLMQPSSPARDDRVPTAGAGATGSEQQEVSSVDA